MSLRKAIWDNWRSAISFPLTFIVIGLLLAFEPGWLYAVGGLSRWLKEGAIGIAQFLGWESVAGGFEVFVGDTAITWGIFMLLTRALIITSVVWLVGLVVRRRRNG